MIKKALPIANLVAVIIMIGWNYYSSTGGINGVTVEDMSTKYDNYFTPAPYAFSIWGLIFLTQLITAILIIKAVFNNSMSLVSSHRLSIQLVKIHVANMLWTWFWINDQTFLSVVVMLLLLAYLIALSRFANKQSDISGIIKFSLNIYVGWIAVATIANVSAFLVKLDWSPIISEISWAAVMILVAGVLNVFMVIREKNYAFSFIGIWALIAIAVRHWDSGTMLQWFALASIVLIAISYVVSLKNNHKDSLSHD